MVSLMRTWFNQSQSLEQYKYIYLVCIDKKLDKRATPVSGHLVVSETALSVLRRRDQDRKKSKTSAHSKRSTQKKKTLV